MLTILLALLLDFVLMLVLIGYRVKAYKIRTLLVLILLFASLLALFAPITGYDSKVLIKEVEIGPYVEQNLFSFTYIKLNNSVILNEEGEIVKEPEKVTIPFSKAKIVFENEGYTPTMRVYEKKLKNNIWWGFASTLIKEVKEYEIHIPIRTN